MQDMPISNPMPNKVISAGNPNSPKSYQMHQELNIPFYYDKKASSCQTNFHWVQQNFPLNGYRSSLVQQVTCYATVNPLWFNMSFFRLEYYFANQQRLSEFLKFPAVQIQDAKFDISLLWFHCKKYLLVLAQFFIFPLVQCLGTYLWVNHSGSAIAVWPQLSTVTGTWYPQVNLIVYNMVFVD